jgi:hypothetical protein
MNTVHYYIKKFYIYFTISLHDKGEYDIKYSTLSLLYTLYTKGNKHTARGSDAVQGTASCGPFNVLVSNLQLGPFLVYSKSGWMPQNPQFGITIFV